MSNFWDECLALPSKIKDWDGYVNLNASIHKLLLLLPILHRLHAKVRYLTFTISMPWIVRVQYMGASWGKRTSGAYEYFIHYTLYEYNKDFIKRLIAN